jgi:hypothetical protein
MANIAGSGAAEWRAVTFVAISDTHTKHAEVKLPPGIDVLIHAGDFTTRGSCAEVTAFAKWLRELPIPIKIVIAGNHDRAMERDTRSFSGEAYAQLTDDDARAAGVVYLQQEAVLVHGFTIWGSAFQPAFWGGFQRRRGSHIAAEWAAIPESADVVVTHGPAYGHGDLVFGFGAGVDDEDAGVEVVRVRASSLGARNVGCKDLLAALMGRVRPALCVAGHIHEGYGITQQALPPAAAGHDRDAAGTVSGDVCVDADPDVTVRASDLSPVLLPPPSRRVGAAVAASATRRGDACSAAEAGDSRTCTDVCSAVPAMKLGPAPAHARTDGRGAEASRSSEPCEASHVDGRVADKAGATCRTHEASEGGGAGSMDGADAAAAAESPGTVTFLNAASVTQQYMPWNEPIVFTLCRRPPGALSPAAAATVPPVAAGGVEAPVYSCFAAHRAIDVTVWSGGGRRGGTKAGTAAGASQGAGAPVAKSEEAASDDYFEL